MRATVNKFLKNENSKHKNMALNERKAFFTQPPYDSFLASY